MFDDVFYRLCDCWWYLKNAIKAGQMREWSNVQNLLQSYCMRWLLNGRVSRTEVRWRMRDLGPYR